MATKANQVSRDIVSPHVSIVGGMFALDGILGRVGKWHGGGGGILVESKTYVRRRVTHPRRSLTKALVKLETMSAPNNSHMPFYEAKKAKKLKFQQCSQFY